jgi:hypothetical protein
MTHIVGKTRHAYKVDQTFQDMGRLRQKCKDNIKMDLREIWCICVLNKFNWSRSESYVFL